MPFCAEQAPPGVDCLNFCQWLEFWVEQTPDKPAVICDHRTLTFSELNARANRLARYLTAAGVGPEVLVGICVPRSVEMLVSLLGVLKAGGAYLFMDPAHPPERVASIFQGARMPFILAHQNSSSDLARHTLRLISLEEQWPAVDRQSAANLPHTPSPDHLACVMCTSGSTASPKGVMLTHANLTERVISYQQQLGFRADDISLCSASIAVARFLRQCITPLSHGVTVVVATEEQRKDPIALLTLAKQHSATFLDSVPSFLRSLTGMLSEMDPLTRNTLLDNRIRLISTGGESLAADAPRTWMHEFRHPAEHIHTYGQTETGSVAAHLIPAALELSSPLVPIGREPSNVEIHLLDRDGQPVPQGEPGEVHVAGPGVSRGYFNQPELTERKFVAHPTKPALRLFKTGDWARRLPDGNLVHLGRQDDQIKIRGFRVDTNEIEAILARHPGVHETAVVAREDVPGRHTLVAYVVLAQADPTIEDKLRQFLGARLPDYMLPAHYVVLDRLPTLPPSGKLDRRALPAPGVPTSRAIWRAPRNKLEEALAALFAELLNIERVGIDDDFFELGGQSLLAMQLVSRLRVLLGADLALGALLEAPTVAGIAAVIESQQARPRTYIVPIQPRGTRPAFFCCVPGPDGSVLGLRHLGRHLGFDQPLYGIPAIDLTDQPRSCILDMASYCIREMRKVQPAGPYFLGGWSFGGLIALEIALQLLAAGDRVALLSLLDTRVTQRLSAPRFFKYRAYFHARQFARLSLPEKFAYIGSRIRRHAAKSAYQARHGSYHPELYPGPVTLFRSADSRVKFAENPTLGWEAIARQGVEILDVPGDHVAMLQPPHVSVLAEKLAACLERTAKP